MFRLEKEVLGKGAELTRLETDMWTKAEEHFQQVGGGTPDALTDRGPWSRDWYIPGFTVIDLQRGRS
jgi:hypothetical protein